MSDSGSSDNKWAENTEQVEEEVRGVKTHNDFTHAKKQHNSEKSRTETTPLKEHLNILGNTVIRFLAEN